MGNRQFITQYRKLNYFASADAIVAVGAGSEAYELCHVLFAKDGSIYIQFRFEPGSAGVVNILRSDPNVPGPVTLSYSEGGRTTNHLVKLSHHTSGRAHLGQNGKTTNEVRRYTFPLDGPEGLVFQFDAYHLSGFRPVTELKRKRAYFPFIFTDGKLPDAVTVTGEWLRKDTIIRRTPAGTRKIDPMTSVQNRSTGATAKVFFLGQPKEYPLREHVLVLSLAPTALPSGVDEPGMILFAGLNHPAADPPDLQEPGLLFLMYPGGDQLKDLLPTIDLSAMA